MLYAPYYSTLCCLGKKVWNKKCYSFLEGLKNLHLDFIQGIVVACWETSVNLGYGEGLESDVA